MKKVYYLLFLCLSASSTMYSQNTVIKGKITDVDTMMVLFRSMDKCDTVFTSNGRFVFNKKLSSPEFFSIVCIKGAQSINAIKEGNERKMRSKEDGVYRELFLENGEVFINTTFAGLNQTKVQRQQHAMQDKYDEFWKRFNPLIKMARMIIDSSYTYKNTENEKKIFSILYAKVNQVENEVAEKFVTENTNNAAGAYVLYRYCRIEDRHKMDSLYGLFPPALQSTGYLHNIKDKIKALAALKPGQAVPSFDRITSERRNISVTSMRGKYLVLDFWGSWCTPCISGFPKMKEYYTSYADKIEFIGIACKDTGIKWKNAIEKYALTWPQILNGDDTNDLAVKYNVEAYPTKILIDRNGKFIQAFTGEGKDFYKKLDELMATP